MADGFSQQVNELRDQFLCRLACVAGNGAWLETGSVTDIEGYLIAVEIDGHATIVVFWVEESDFFVADDFPVVMPWRNGRVAMQLRVFALDFIHGKDERPERGLLLGLVFDAALIHGGLLRFRFLLLLGYGGFDEVRVVVWSVHGGWRV